MSGGLGVVFLGPPGAGKGTQAARLARQLGVPHVSTGDMLRRVRDDGTALAERVAAIMDRGELVPDDVIIALVRERLGRPDARGGWLLDGFPRTLGQAEALGASLGDRVGRVLLLEAPDDVIVERLAGRRTCASCQRVWHLRFDPPPAPDRCQCGGALVVREDDREQAVRRRLVVYREQTAPLRDYYRGAGLLRELDGDGTSDQVARRVSEAVGAAPVASIGA